MYKGEDDLQRVGECRATTRRPVGMLDGEFEMFNGFAVRFLPRDSVLYQGRKTGMPLRRVMVNTKNKEEVMEQLHDE